MRILFLQWTIVTSSIFASLPLLLPGCSPGENRTVDASAPAQNVIQNRAQPDRHVGLFNIGGQQREMPYIKQGNFAVIGGDVVLSLPEQQRNEKNNLTKDQGLALAGTQQQSLFPGGIVPYVFEGGFTGVDVFNAVIAEWHQKTVVRFVPRTTEATYLIVTHNADPGVDLNGVCGYSAGVGVRQAGSPQKIFIKPDCITHRTISHELGHAIGLFHEHSRPDRDAFIDVFPQNLLSGALGQLDKTTWAQFFGEYDITSIMHYNSLGGSANGQPIMKAKNGTLIPINVNLSERDVAGINLLYGSQRCEIILSECTSNRLGLGAGLNVWMDREQVAQNPDGCAARAKEFSDFCGNKKGTRTWATFVDKTVDAKQKMWTAPQMGCEIELTTCSNAKIAANQFIIDDYDGSASNKDRCMARAKEYSDFCRNEEGADTYARYYSPSLASQLWNSFRAKNFGCTVRLLGGCPVNPAIAQNPIKDAHEGADTNADRCMLRAKEYSDYCETQAGALTSVSYYDGQTEKYSSFSAPYQGCKLIPSTCTKNPAIARATQLFPRSSAAGSSQASCSTQAKSIFEGCEGSLGEFVTGEYYEKGGILTPIAYGSGIPGCYVEIGACPAFPARTSTKFSDTLGAAAKSKDVCFANARAYHAICRKPLSDPVVVTFVDSSQSGNAATSREAWSQK